MCSWSAAIIVLCSRLTIKHFTMKYKTPQARLLLDRVFPSACIGCQPRLVICKLRDTTKGYIVRVDCHHTARRFFHLRPALLAAGTPHCRCAIVGGASRQPCSWLLIFPIAIITVFIYALSIDTP